MVHAIGRYWLLYCIPSLEASYFWKQQFPIKVARGYHQTGRLYCSRNLFHSGLSYYGRYRMPSIWPSPSTMVKYPRRECLRLCYWSCILYSLVYNLPDTRKDDPKHKQRLETRFKTQQEQPFYHIESTINRFHGIAVGPHASNVSNKEQLFHR